MKDASLDLERLNFRREAFERHCFGLFRFSRQKFHSSPRFAALPRRPRPLQLLLGGLGGGGHGLLRGRLLLPHRAGCALDLGARARV